MRRHGGPDSAGRVRATHHNAPGPVRSTHPTRLGVALRIALGGVCLFTSMLLYAAEPAPKKHSRGVLIRFEGVIEPMLEQYLYRKLEVAKQENADLVIVEIESPGGMVDPSLAIAARLRDLDWAHTVAYVPRKALSGAAIVALGCDEIIMGPHAKLGDAGPIYLDEGFVFRHAPEKFRTDLVREVRDLAEAKGRPAALAEAMVDMDLVVWQVKNRKTGDVAFMSEDEIASAPDPGQWEKLNPVHESRKKQFLEVGGSRAVELQLAQGTAESRDDLKRRYGLEEDLLVLEHTGVDTAVAILNNPWITGLLFVVGLVALFIEFSAPGIGLGGLTAGLCFAIFFWSRFLGGTANWLEVVLFVSGLAFLAVELFVLPGFGVAGLAGVFLLLASLVMASHTFVIPSNARQMATMINTVLVILASGVAVSVAAFALSKYLGEIPILGRFTLHPPDAAAAGAPGEGRAGGQFGVAIGQTGVADSPLRPAGRVRFGDEYVDVVTEGAFVAKDTQVRVIKIGGNRVVVREVES